MVDVIFQPDDEDKIIIVEQKEISIAVLKGMVGNTTNLIADVQFDGNSQVRVELESERRLGDSSDIVMKNNGIRIYII